MAHTIEQLATDFRTALKAEPGPAGRQKVCAMLRDALKDDAFIKTTFSDTTPERQILHEDPELGFCQVEGETAMSDWELVTPATPDVPGKVKHKNKYKLTPGVAHLYNEGDLHSPSRVGPTRLLRIEGTNMEKVKRMKYEALA
jgi:hypothetical protein